MFVSISARPQRCASEHSKCSGTYAPKARPCDHHSRRLTCASGASSEPPQDCQQPRGVITRAVCEDDPLPHPGELWMYFPCIGVVVDLAGNACLRQQPTVDGKILHVQTRERPLMRCSPPCRLSQVRPLAPPHAMLPLHAGASRNMQDFFHSEGGPAMRVSFQY